MIPINVEKSFQVSVITPVYNAARYVRKAVESAVSLPEVGEVILIDDAGPDNAWEVCQQLAAEYPKVRLLRHPDGKNHGAGASRNLGIREASCPFVAFLDADDWYLPNRFAADTRILGQEDSIDGVYNAVGNYYESEDLRQMWLSQGRPEKMTLSDVVSPEELPFVLLHDHPSVTGEFQTDAITVRRHFFEIVGFFHEGLRLQQDTHMWKRMAAIGRLAAGNIVEPVVIRRVHPENRMTKTADHAQYMELWWSDLGKQFRSAAVRRDVMQAYRRGFAYYRQSTGPKWKAWVAFLSWLARDPRQISLAYGFFDLSVFDLCRKHWLAVRLISAKNRFFRVVGICTAKAMLVVHCATASLPRE
ncbi:MAG: glycosyltransferase [Planctomycetales bacterium]|nr:glycosyltransferase [Planctomycetales bacterium]